MTRFAIVGLVAIGAIALAGVVPVGATDEQPANEKAAAVGPHFVDTDGDGVCDNCTGVARGPGRGQGQCHMACAGSRGRGPRDGSGRQVGPRDGSGRGQGPSGRCDGTGPKGRRQGRRVGWRR